MGVSRVGEAEPPAPGLTPLLRGPLCQQSGAGVLAGDAPLRPREVPATRVLDAVSGHLPPPLRTSSGLRGGRPGHSTRH